MFHEYKYVQRNTENLDLLKQLYRFKMQSVVTAGLLSVLRNEFKLPPYVLDFTGRKETSGTYWWHGSRIVLARITRAEVAIHELAHHYVDKKLEGHGAMIHGADFVMCLDKLAVKAAEVLQIGEAQKD